MKTKEIQSQLASSIVSMSDKSIIAGASARLMSRNISMLRRVFVSGEKIDDVLTEVKISRRHFLRIAKKMASLKVFESKLEDNMSSIAMPRVYAKNQGEALNYLSRTYCSSLELNGWRIVINGARHNLADIY